MDFHHHNHQPQQQQVSDKMPQRHHQNQYDSLMVSDTQTATLNLLSEQQQINCGLARYRSAPSSYFASCHDVTSNANSSTSIKSGDYLGDELDNFLNGLMPSNHISAQEQAKQSTFVASIQSQPQDQQNCFSPSIIGQPLDQQNFNPAVVANATSSVDDSYKFSSWNRIDKGVTNSNLIRYNSSPAGLIAAGNIANEYGAVRGLENIGAGKNANAVATFASTSRYTRPLPKIATRSMGENDLSKRSEGAHITGIPVVPWDDSSLLSNSFLEGLSNEDNQSFSNEDNEVQNAVTTGAPTLLSRHLSLPMTSTELSGVETLMQDSVLCKLRAKRGCATHPRSIAERVRRTRISERMRKLQELVPNMEKQSNTADMLDMAVDYIKGLQDQVKALSEKRATCTCSKYH